MRQLILILLIGLVIASGCSSPENKPPAESQRSPDYFGAPPPVDEARQKQIKELVEQLSSQDWEKQLNAVDALIELDAKEAIPDIINLLQDNEDIVRTSAVWALGELGNKEAIPTIIKLLNDPAVRWSAVNALGKLGAKESVPELVKLLDDDSKHIRGITAVVLVELGTKDKVPAKSIEDIKIIAKGG